MRYIDEYRNRELIKRIAGKLSQIDNRKYLFMEVCGGHTMVMHRFGIHSLLPENIRLISGPGCPVCVTSKLFIDKVIAYSRIPGTIITTFGDLVRVKGSVSSLEREKASGADIRVVLSPLEALDIAVNHSGKNIIFPGIGFETTAPGTAAVIKEASLLGVKNFFLLSAHKVMPPAMEAILRDGAMIDGFICPGHVSAITGSKIFDFIPEKYKLCCVVAGFEPLDMLQALYMLVIQAEEGNPHTEIQYKRVVTREGNRIAQQIMDEVFIHQDDEWRGLSVIKASGLKLRDTYGSFDVEKAIPVEVKEQKDDGACICGEILRGKSVPEACPLFGVKCHPSDPVGACMVSSEGACQIHYKYGFHG